MLGKWKIRRGLIRAWVLFATENPPRGLPWEAFTRELEGEWFATRDVMLPGVSGSMLIRAGQQVDDELQQRLDDWPVSCCDPHRGVNKMVDAAL